MPTQLSVVAGSKSSHSCQDTRFKLLKLVCTSNKSWCAGKSIETPAAHRTRNSWFSLECSNNLSSNNCHLARCLTSCKVTAPWLSRLVLNHVCHQIYQGSSELLSCVLKLVCTLDKSWCAGKKHWDPRPDIKPGPLDLNSLSFAKGFLFNVQLCWWISYLLMSIPRSRWIWSRDRQWISKCLAQES